jgi:RND family efflux transporter MFP subunit
MSLFLTKKKIVIGALIFLFFGAVVSFAVFFSNDKNEVFLVKSQSMTEEVVATGRVEGLTSASFGFKNGGKVTSLLVSVGDTVKKGQELLFQDTSALDSQIAELDAAIRVERARLSQLRAGSSLEEIEIVSSNVEGAGVALESAETNLTIAKQAVVDALKSTYTIAEDGVKNKADKLFTNPNSNDPRLLFQSSNFLLGNELEAMRVGVGKELKELSKEVSGLSVDSDLSGKITAIRKRVEAVKVFLEKTSQYTVSVEALPSALLQTSFEVTKAELTQAKNAINSSLSQITQAQATFTQTTSVKASAKTTLTTVNRQLEQVKASARGTDVAVYQAQLEQAMAAKRKVETLRSDFVITAPFDGVITDVPIKLGEVAQGGVPAVSILSYEKLQIKANIVEHNIVRVRIGQQVFFTLDAMPSKKFKGKVIAIDPAEKEINNTIYYKATIDLEEKVEFLRPGMTANVFIVASQLEDIIAVPAASIFEREGVRYVKVLRGKDEEERVVTVGIYDREGMVQIIEGLQSNEIIALSPTL